MDVESLQSDLREGEGRRNVARIAYGGVTILE